MHIGVKAEQEGDGHMRGSIEGGLWALVISAAGLTTASIIAEPPAGNTPPAAPQLAAPAVDPAATVADGAVQAPAQEPVAPQAPAPATLTETAPEVTPQENLSTQPPALSADVVAILDAPTTGEAPTTPRTTQPPLVYGLGARLETPTPSVPPQIDASTFALPEEPAEIIEDTVEVEPEPAVTAASEPAEEAPVIETDVEEVATPEPAPVLPAPPADVAEAADDPGTNGVVINRPTTETAVVTQPEEAIIAPDALPDDATALERYAAEFENPNGLPVIAILLIDDGALPDANAALAALPFAPTIAIDALAENAGDRLASHRGMGAEVAVQIRLPNGAQPSDVEVAYGAALGLVPQAAMLFSDGTGVMQNNRSVAGQVMEILSVDGQGFVTVQRGLGNAARLAESAGVPAATVLRDIDGNGESASVILRNLDQAAFRARQSGNAVLMGRLTSQTLAVLQDWAADAAQNGVAAGPVSAILLDQAD